MSTLVFLLGCVHVPPGPYRDLYKDLRSIPHGGQSDWDEAVKPLMVEAFDQDRSGMIDTAAEINVVPCDIWVLLDEAIHKGRDSKVSSLRVTYAEPPWLTHLIGVDQVVEAEMMQIIGRCGLR